MEILIGADVVPTLSNKHLFKNGNIERILGIDLFDKWKNVDVRIFNLEVPLTDKSKPISKKGPNLIAPTNTINGIDKLDPTLVTLANNHILDQGEEGLISTGALLKK